MHTFAQMMEKLMAGTFDMEIPASLERAGIVTPAMLMRVGSQDETMSGALFEAVGIVMKNLDEYTEKLRADPEIMRQAQPILGYVMPDNQAPIGVEDLYLARISWRMNHCGTRLEMSAWHSTKAAITTYPDKKTWEIVWPELNDETADFWPVRHLRQALKLALFQGALRATPAPKH